MPNKNNSTKAGAHVDMNTAFFLRTEDRNPSWKVVDAEGQVLGRLATRVANILRGKDKAAYTPHTDGGDYVVVINADKVVLTGNKETDKIYVSHSGWMGGKKEVSAEEKRAKHPTDLVRLAVKRMLPKNKLSREVIKKLKIYAGSEHPHVAQQPKEISF